jgi:predicted nucleic acid-binding protein
MLLDTSGLFRLFHRPEVGHAEAIEFFEAADWAVTHSYVLAEFVALATARGVPRREALAAIDAILAIAYLEVVWVDERLHRRAMAFLRQRIDKTYSLADAVSFLIMSDREIREALTTDHHFEQAGFVRLLRPS